MILIPKLKRYGRLLKFIAQFFLKWVLITGNYVICIFKIDDIDFLDKCTKFNEIYS